MRHLRLEIVAAPGRYPYVSNTTNMTYVLSTYNSTFADANMECKLQVGCLLRAWQAKHAGWRMTAGFAQLAPACLRLAVCDHHPGR